MVRLALLAESGDAEITLKSVLHFIRPNAFADVGLGALWSACSKHCFQDVEIFLSDVAV